MPLVKADKPVEFLPVTAVSQVSPRAVLSHPAICKAQPRFQPSLAPALVFLRRADSAVFFVRSCGRWFPKSRRFVVINSPCPGGSGMLML